MILEKLVIPIGFDTGLLLEGIAAIEGLISGAIDRTREWAEGMDQLGDVTGMANDELSAWSFVAKKAGVEIDTLSNATVIMAKGLFDSAGELSTTGKALQDFGVDILDANGNVLEQSELMDNIARKYAEFGTQTERVDFLTNVFGRSGAKLVDVFDTLSKEGGIDQVKQKVEALGLTLDPTMYEDFQRNLNEVDLTMTGLANAFTGPLLPGAQSLLKTFTDWLQSPWIANAISEIGNRLGTLASDIAKGIDTGNWDKFFADFKEFTGLDLQPLIDEFRQFTVESETARTAISIHWEQMLTKLSGLLNEVFGTKGINLVIDWSQIGVTALQLLDLMIMGLGGWFQWLTQMVNNFKASLREVGSVASSVLQIVSQALSFNVPTFGTPKKSVSVMRHQAAGGMGGGLTWVGERGPELVNLPGGSFVNSAQSSAGMGFDYYKLASILAVEFAKARD